MRTLFRKAFAALVAAAVLLESPGLKPAQIFTAAERPISQNSKQKTDAIAYNSRPDVLTLKPQLLKLKDQTCKNSGRFLVSSF